MWRQSANHSLSLRWAQKTAPWEFYTKLLHYFFTSNNKSNLHFNESCHTNEWVMSHIWMSHVTHIDESCHPYEWVMSHIWMSHVTHMNGSCHTSEGVMSHIWKGHVTHMNASCHTDECVMSQLWTSHVTRMNASCHTYERVTQQEQHTPVITQSWSEPLCWRCVFSMSEKFPNSAISRWIDMIFWKYLDSESVLQSRMRLSIL